MRRTTLAALLGLSLLGAFAACGQNQDVIGHGTSTTTGTAGGWNIGPGVDCENGPNYTNCPCNPGDTIACYTGPVATRDVGACHDGVQTCEEQQELRYAFGACDGEVLPSAANGQCVAPVTPDGGPPPAGDDEHVVQVANLGLTLCAVTTAGHVACNGLYPGDGTTPDGSASVTTLKWVPGLTDAVAVSGNSGPCVLQSTGSVACWGQNESGQAGDGTTVTPRTSPVKVSGLSDAVEIVSGTWHVCARRATGEVVCWGDNCIGQLGDGNGHHTKYADQVCAQHTIPTPVPVKVAGITDAVQIAAGAFHTCARLKSGSVKCWGGPGQVVGDGSSGLASHPPDQPDWLVHPSPVDVVGLTDAVDLSAGGGVTCAVRSNGVVACWGGGIGSSTLPPNVVPTPLAGLSGAKTLRMGQSVVCALLASGAVRCWGGNQWGGLGNGSILSFGDFTETSVPGSPVVGLSDASLLDMANTDAPCAVRATHDGVCWGEDVLGSMVKDAQGHTSSKYFTKPTPIVLPQ
jgi:hypothetical protein